jgi:hypothetical protein
MAASSRPQPNAGATATNPIRIRTARISGSDGDRQRYSKHRDEQRQDDQQQGADDNADHEIKKAHSSATPGAPSA